MTFDFTWSELLTVPGAAAAAVAITQLGKRLIGWPDGAKEARLLVLALGVALLLAATGTTSGWTVGLLLAAFPNGIAAGAAAVAAYDTATSGIDYAVLARGDYVGRVGPT